MVETLIRSGADLNMRDGFGETPQELAARLGSDSIIQAFNVRQDPRPRRHLGYSDEHIEFYISSGFLDALCSIIDRGLLRVKASVFQRLHGYYSIICHYSQGVGFFV